MYLLNTLQGQMGGTYEDKVIQIREQRANVSGCQAQYPNISCNNRHGHYHNFIINRRVRRLGLNLKKNPNQMKVVNFRSKANLWVGKRGPYQNWKVD